MIKLIVSDLDGTLLPYTESKVSAEVVRTIAAILEKGITFAISSGRTYNELDELLPEFRDSIYYTCCDGALTVKNGKVIYSRKIEHCDMEHFFKNNDPDFSFVLHGAFENYSMGNVPSEAAKYSCSPEKRIKGIYQVKEKIYKITSYGDGAQLSEYSGIRRHWDGGENKTSQYVNRFANKGTALSDLQTRLMLTKYDTAVLGDRGNDVCMVKGSCVSYCIGDNCPELKSVCTHSKSNGLDALRELLFL